MKKMRLKSIALVAVAVFSACVSLAYSGEKVTKETLEKICPELEVSKRSIAGGTLAVEINVPASEARLERLFQAWLTISGKDQELSLRVPVRIIEVKGAKRIFFDASPAMLKNAKLALDCKREDPAVSSRDTWNLDLPSLLGIAG